MGRNRKRTRRETFSNGVSNKLAEELGTIPIPNRMEWELNEFLVKSVLVPSNLLRLKRSFEWKQRDSDPNWKIRLVLKGGSHLQFTSIHQPLFSSPVENTNLTSPTLRGGWVAEGSALQILLSLSRLVCGIASRQILDW